ncbi:FAD-binding oxidoreductase [Pseudomonas sp. G5(2012)]|uniref:FAD-binding oxidoreductase n=1 Tax=Pseudomonas sp. G5(2012) TaxID=1268068 RepID=UPI00034314D7|nr:FAD-binding oxidoreductase [Pseudomonas sp. G5(2012)]EPA99352.1 4-cresol dehydrogenase (hydroxylating) flavoprotein subunit [Pseudomonas sp. G5(2012)]
MDTTVMLPAGVSTEQFSKAIAEFRLLLGEDNVLATAERVVPYTKLLIPTEDDASFMPSGALTPGSVEEVQKILAICNRYKLPVWPISTGRNWGYGSASPATPGQLILDLRKMNKIIEIDVDSCTALLEPGVTYQQLYDHLKENNIPLMLDVPTIGPMVGPVGNTLDRGVGYTPYGEHFMMQCGMEVVLANGEILRTGMGSVPKAKTWQAFKWGYGPYVDGIFTQSNFGVVTKMGLWLMPKPPVIKPFMVRYQNESDVVKAIDAMRPLRINQLIPNVVLFMHGHYETAICKTRAEVTSDPGPISEADARKVFKELGIGYWNVYFALYGTAEQIAVNEKIVRSIIEPSGGEIVTEAEAGDNILFHHHKQLMCGEMTMEEMNIYRWRGAGGGACWFAPVAQVKGQEAELQVKLAQRVLAKHNLDYTAGFAIGWRDLHHIIDVLYDRNNAEEKKRAYACFDELIEVFAAEGFASYRTNIAFMDKVAKKFGSTNMHVNQQIKKALDPNGILAPGKSGIHLPD